MTGEALQINSLLMNPTFWVLFAWLLKELFGSFKSADKKHTQAIELNSAEVQKLTLALVRFEVKLETVEKVSAAIPKILQDINVLHERVRALKPLQGDAQ